jgi:hypothetical protein
MPDSHRKTTTRVMRVRDEHGIDAVAPSSETGGPRDGVDASNPLHTRRVIVPRSVSAADVDDLRGERTTNVVTRGGR